MELARFTAITARQAALHKASIYPSDHYKAIGKLGGLETIRKYGIEYMRMLAVKGGNAWADKHYFSDTWTADFYGFKLDSNNGECSELV